MDLAHEPALRLGGLDVRPSTREIVFSGGREVVEPRVMAVLVVLARARGEVVTRDQLIEACWQGRVVSDDAINRVISRIRRISELTGKQDFTLETITKVGYRLVPSGIGQVEPVAPVAPGEPSRTRFHLDRRMLLASGVGIAAISGAVAWRLLQSPSPPSRAEELYRRAIEIGATDDAAEVAQSISFLREAVGLSPDYADAWAALALAYVYGFATNPPEKHAALSERAKDAANRALALDPDNADALGALALLPPIYQRWEEAEKTYRQALARQPRLAPVSRALAELLGSTGRTRESVPLSERAVAQTPLIARRHYELALTYWYAGRLEDAERTIQKAHDLWPRDISVWFGRLYQLMYGGNIRRALDMLADKANRPPGVPESDFQLVEVAALALQSGSAADRTLAVDMNMAAARGGLGYARNAVIFAAALGDLDAAFSAANAYYFDEPFPVARTYFTPEQGEYLGVRSRETMFLFAPPLGAWRADARFEQLVSAIGLDSYWRSAGATPDYRRNRPR
ncbi:MAG: winged helix-turn-helix domain-containing protein [Hyphomonadaceae bacterium]|nr:winged helix-turn-helix domain-containing protein [Hyphomonadaceae bacterium]